MASTLEGVYRKIRKIHKHRHEVIKQDRQEFEDELEQINRQLDLFREYTSYNDQENNGHCKKDDEWCCEEGEEGCDENEYEECNEGEEGCEEYDPDKELILREVDFDIYIVEVDEYVGTTIEERCGGRFYATQWHHCQ